MLTPDWLAGFWSHSALEVNAVVFLNLLGALALGLLVGYERSYHGRAAGMRTYGIVCMASAALTVFAGYPDHWYGGGHATVLGVMDPTRVVQGIVTGVGFLGAGVIMKEGLNISGLTTAASIWASCAIGVLVGIGFYGAAILLALLSAALMMWGSRIEGNLPSRHAIAVHVAQQLAGPARAISGFQELLTEQVQSLGLVHMTPDLEKVGTAACELNSLIDSLIHGQATPQLGRLRHFFFD